MDQMTYYHDRVQTCLADWYAYITRSPLSGVDTEYVIDDRQHIFMITNTGWHNGERVRDVFIHIRIRKDKIWIEEDGTEDGTATELLRLGVPREDIVLAFHPPQLRHLTEFANV